ncbi:MAG: hypothetical protein KJ676_11610 [Alphaproteobacteria bacterium]|nr:hypothetical protein [Alphaproteobacteria bacterium]MBU1526386.1 hypothetical protein [Alphaproteobacteria bacterium]MBU2116514.1 hypothetical protein [Alphaproteobacteria bacterium]MBU2351469.1 hypothetical protein [Alphaproteobacteria bacterium]MBU2383592.1 hypothetical protein [Alphaproteobacteria bacterium]
MPAYTVKATGSDEVNGLSGNLGIEALLDLTGADREAKAYAFLYAAFRNTEISDNPVRDSIDCLVPFMAPYLNQIPGQPIKVDGVCQYMKSAFGFDFPLYAMQQLINDLPKHGLAEYNRISKSHIAKAVPDDFGIAKAEIETNFDHISERLAEYARRLQFHTDPPSGTWGDALINFLKGTADPSGRAAVKIRGSVLDARKSESAVVGGFIKGLYATDSAAFDKLLHVFLGVLVEEFISTVSEIGDPSKKVDVKVFYDTAVLLRLLGTSGKMLRSATEELTRYLQDLGCDIYYFAGNESEVANIFNTIVHIKDSGGELEGETAEAISIGEVNISEIRMLQNSFTERLAALNVFPADGLEVSAVDNARHQISESGFSAYLLEQANASGRAYGAQNREHDAQYLGSVMRMRSGIKTRDFSNCRYVFITSNKFLASISRRYLIKDKMLLPQHFPPMLSVGQMATIAWLMKDHKLVPEKAGRELLSNCFAAVRPDAEWFKHFREGMEKATGSIEAYGRDATNTLTLQAARRMAQEESLGSATLVRELNMAEILSRAEGERDKIVAQQQAELEALSMANERDKEGLLQEANAARAQELADTRIRHQEALEATRIQAEAATAEMVRAAHHESALKSAKAIVGVIRGLMLIAFFGMTAWTIYMRVLGDVSIAFWIASAVLGAVTVVTFANFLKIPVVTNWIPNLEQWLAERFLP